MGGRGNNSHIKADTVLDTAIKAYSARGGIYASKYPYSQELSNTLSNAVNTKSYTVSNTLYRGLDLSEQQWSDLFYKWYNGEETTMPMLDINSFTEDRTRGYGFGGTGQHITLVLLKGSNVHGLDISKQSIYDEQEVLIGGKSDKYIIANIEFRSSGQPLVYIRKK